MHEKAATRSKVADIQSLLFRLLSWFDHIHIIHHNLPMDLKTNTKAYLDMFYVIGISSYHPKKNKKAHLVVAYMKFIQTSICSLIGIVGLYILSIEGVSRVYKTSEAIILNIYIGCDMVRAAAILAQCICLKSTLNEVMCIFYNLESYFASHLKYRICYCEFSRQFFYRAVLILSVNVMYIFGFIIRYITGDAVSSVGFLTKVLQLMTTLTYLQIIFYVDLLNYHLRQLNTVLYADLCAYNCNRAFEMASGIRLRSRLKAYKVIHFRLWMVSQKINQYFGWSLIIIHMHVMTDLIFSILRLWQVELLSMWSKLFVWDWLMHSFWNHFICLFAEPITYFISSASSCILLSNACTHLSMQVILV